MAFTGGLQLRRGDGAVTEVFTLISEVFNMGGLGQTNPTIKSTHWGSTAHEYIAGLADGDELSIEMNRILSDAQQDALIADVDNKLNRNFEFDMGDGVAVETFSFSLAMTSWQITPANEDRHTLTVSGKLSGAITRVTV